MKLAASAPDDPTTREELLDRIGSRQLIVSISGGKDSTATALHLLRELDLPVELVHMDTGWEHLDTEAYLRELPTYLGQEIHVVRSLPDLDEEQLEHAERLEAKYRDGRPSAYVRWILAKGMFSARMRRWCTSYLKVYPFQEFAFGRHGRDSSTGIGNFINVVGVRGDESTRRAKMPIWEMDDDGYVIWRPIHGWTEVDVIDIHRRYGVPPNPLYTRGAARVGCWPCINCRKAELRQVADTDPDRIALIAELEEIITEAAKARAIERGEDFTHPDGSEKFRAFFQNPNYRKELRRLRKAAPPTLSPEEAKAWAKDRARVMAPIGEVVEWSRTNRKGEPEPFAPLPHEAGCTRWGFCDTSWRDDAEDNDNNHE